MGKGNDSRHIRRRPAPISAHPAFATLVSAWFAALFGFGSLIPSIDPFARFLGLHAAAPFILVTLKLALAALLGLVGFMLGRAIAQLVARNHARASQEEPGAARAPTMRDIEEDAARRPIIAHEELGEGLGPVLEDGWDDSPTNEEFTQEPVAQERFDSPWLADEDGHIWSEELADAPLALSSQDILPSNTTPVVPETPLAELNMVELIDRLAQAIQSKHGLARGLPDNAAEMVRKLDAEVQANNTAYASFKDIEALNEAASTAAASVPVCAPVDAAVVFPDASARRSQPPERGEIPIAADDREGDALRSALETLRRMSGTA